MTQAAPIPAGAQAKLRILATTDLHMNLTSFDYLSARPDPTVGLTRTAALIRAARHQAQAAGALCLLFDNGDALQGAPLGDMAGAGPAGAPHPLMRAFAHLGYDAVGLGNHDFNYGLAALDAALAQAPCPVICSNLRQIGNRVPQAIRPWAVLDRSLLTAQGAAPVRIGLLSFVPPQTLQWDAHLLTGEVEIDDIVASALARIPELEQAGCDLILALAHSGLDDRAADPGMENAVIPLAALDRIDAIIGGHTHTCLPGPQGRDMRHVDAAAGKVHGKPVVIAGASGSHLGVIDLTLATDGSGGWTVGDSRCDLRPIACRAADGRAVSLAEEDAALTDLLAADHARACAFMDQPAGHSPVPLHSYFTFVTPSHALAMVAAAQAAAVRPHLQGTSAADLPLLSAVAPGKFGARAGPDSYTDIPAGPLTRRHLADLHLFPDQLQAVRVTGAQLADWLERAVSLFCQIAPGATEACLINPDGAGHDFDVIYGLTYQIDLSQPARYHPDGSLHRHDSRRIRSLCHNGVAVDPAQHFAVAVNSFRVGGGGNFAALRQARRLALPPITVRDALRAYAGGPLADPLHRAPAPWRFAPMPGTSVTLRTGPGAADHLDELADRGLRNHGLDAGGFLRISLQI
ncbi:bifunctional 2',3'-cyclic-nucleotide 2'-phosphodiesterase/3'-nucleotidase [Pseudooceanicola sp.]